MLPETTKCRNQEELQIAQDCKALFKDIRTLNETLPRLVIDKYLHAYYKKDVPEYLLKMKSTYSRLNTEEKEEFDIVNKNWRDKLAFVDTENQVNLDFLKWCQEQVKDDSDRYAKVTNHIRNWQAKDKTAEFLNKEVWT